LTVFETELIKIKRLTSVDTTTVMRKARNDLVPVWRTAVVDIFRLPVHRWWWSYSICRPVSSTMQLFLRLRRRHLRCLLAQQHDDGAVHNCCPSVRKLRSLVKQELSSRWDGRPFGHNRRGPKVGRGWVPTGSPSNTMWPGPRPTFLPSGIFIHPTVWPQLYECHAPPRRNKLIFIPSLVVKTCTGCVHWVIARYQFKSSK